MFSFVLDIRKENSGCDFIVYFIEFFLGKVFVWGIIRIFFF